MELLQAVGDDDCLLGDIDQVDVVPIDDEAPSDPDEGRLVFAKLIAYLVFYLTELIGNQMLVTILRDYFGVVAFGRDKHQPVRGNPQKFGTGRYDDELGHGYGKDTVL